MTWVVSIVGRRWSAARARVGLQTIFRCFSALQENEFDLCVIGCGAAGFAGAIRAWDYGKKIAIINPKENMGGVSLKNGALSSKVLWQLSRQSRHTKNTTPSFSSIKARVKESVQIKQRHIRKQLADINSVCYSSDEDGGGGHIQYFDGIAHFKSKYVVNVLNPRLSPSSNNIITSIKAKHFLIATGSYPRLLSNFCDVDDEYIITTDDIPDKLQEFPKSLLIFGAGVIGLEFATIFSNYQQCENIYLFNQNRKRLLPNEDADMSEFISQNLMTRENGVQILNDVRMTDMRIDYERKQVQCTYVHNNTKHDTEEETPKTLFVDKVLLAIGRIPNLVNLDLHCVHPELDRESIHDGALQFDPHLRLQKATHISIVGDALGKIGLVSVAEMEARHSIEFMFGLKNPITKLNYEHISSVVFGRPEIACVGMNEMECQSRQIAYKCGLLRLGLINRAVIDWNERHPTGAISPQKFGYVKMITTDDEHKTLLGMRAVGVNSSSMIQTASLIIRKGESIRELSDSGVCNPHPSINEAVVECARMLLGRSIYKPHVWPRSFVRHYTPEKGTAFAEDVLSTQFRKHIVPDYLS